MTRSTDDNDVRGGSPPAPGVLAQTVRASGVALLVVAVQALILGLFAWPAVNTEPRDLPIVVAGPAPAADAVARRLTESEPGAFEVTTVADAEAADQAIRDREAYGALVLAPGVAGPPAVEVHVASAASPTVALLLTEVGRAAGEGGQVEVVDVVAADPDDPRGAALTGGILPLIMTSIMAGILLILLFRSRIARFLGLLGYGVLAGLVATWILQYGLDALGGDYLANAAVIGLVALAMSGAVAGLGAVFGLPGAGAAAAVVFLLGNPLSALASAPEMLPQPWGEVGQWLPPGAGGTLLRSVAYFDGAAADRPVWILVGWAAVGLLTLVGRAGGRPHEPKPPGAGLRDGVHRPQPQPEPVSMT